MLLLCNDQISYLRYPNIIIRVSNVVFAMKVLVDEMYDGFDTKLKEFGYDAFSVKKLKDEGKKLSSDYSVINYARDNGMIVVTEDVEIGEACKENDIRCVLLDREKLLQIMLEELSKYKER